MPTTERTKRKEKEKMQDRSGGNRMDGWATSRNKLLGRDLATRVFCGRKKRKRKAGALAESNQNEKLDKKKPKKEL